MSMEHNLKKYIDEIIQEIESELDEATTTAGVDGYQTPFAFGSGRDSDKKKKKKTATQAGYTLAESFMADLDLIKKRSKDLSDFVRTVLTNKDFKDVKSDKNFHKYLKSFYNESTINERQLKGLEGIDSKTPLSKISDAQKLKIIQGTGNNISFKVPKGFDRNFWQVFSKGKIKKKKDLSGNLVYFLPGKFIDSPNFKSEKDLINGVDWDGVQRTREFNESVISEAKQKRPVNRWLELKNDATMHPHKKMAKGLKELKYQLAETEKFFKWYGKIKSMNELDSANYWKRTNNHIYKIKERLINIAKTLKEIEN